MIEFKTPPVPGDNATANDWANYLTAFAIAQNEANDANRLKEQSLSDIARDACALFIDRTTIATKGVSADSAMLECVRLAKLARSLAA